jgi:hypothetical protein
VRAWLPRAPAVLLYSLLRLLLLLLLLLLLQVGTGRYRCSRRAWGRCAARRAPSCGLAASCGGSGAARRRW